MKLLTTTILAILFTSLKAQQINDYILVDKITMQIPDSMTHSSYRIATYINSNFTLLSDKSRSVFLWVAKNIQYDVENMYAINNRQNPNEIVDEVLIKRKGICLHYANLFNDIMNKLGIKSYVILGYTKQRGFVDYIPHAWCASFIDSTWCLFDPTWGSGHIRHSKFINRINNEYFKVKPELLIKTHMPFDPLWQFLNYPVTSKEFYEDKFSANKNKPFFNYSDTLNRHEQESEINRLISSSWRIEKNGIKNSLIYDRLYYNRQLIENYINKITVEKYNAAVNSYNEGINHLNKFIEYRNKKFTPPKTDNDIKQMIIITETTLTSSRVQLKDIKNPDAYIAPFLIQLNKSIDDALSNLNEEKVFLDNYINTDNDFRKGLFYK